MDKAPSLDAAAAHEYSRVDSSLVA